MNPALRVGLLFGGRSVEHEVSVISARGVAAAMADTAHECVPIAVTREGRWLAPSASSAILESEAQSVEFAADGSGSRVVIDLSKGGLRLLDAAGHLEPLGLDLLFPLIHGWGGEDGRVQGAMDLVGVPYVGSGVVGSAAGMDKALSKRLFEAHGLAVGPWTELSATEWSASRTSVLDRIAKLGLPIFVKPCNGGSSVGIRKVSVVDEVVDAVDFALEHDHDVVVERGIDAREIECAVMGNERPEASGLGEIVASREFYDYEAKYVDGTSSLTIPANLDESQTRDIREQSLVAFRALKLRGLARVDFLVERGTSRVFINEVNTLPGFTPISMFSRLWQAEGVPFPDLVERLVGLAMDPEGA